MVLTKAKPKVPPWLVAVILAMAAPLTGAAVSRGQLLVEKEKGKAELALGKAKQAHDFRMAYFEKAIIGPIEQRMAVLRFISKSFDDRELRRWAEEEMLSQQGHTREADRVALMRCEESCMNQYPMSTNEDPPERSTRYRGMRSRCMAQCAPAHRHLSTETEVDATPAHD